MVVGGISLLSEVQFKIFFKEKFIDWIITNWFLLFQGFLIFYLVLLSNEDDKIRYQDVNLYIIVKNEKSYLVQ